MPKPVHKAEPSTDFGTLYDFVAAESPEVVKEFDQGYEDVIVKGGECQRCGAHVIEKIQVHQDWHKKMDLTIWVLCSAWKVVVGDAETSG